MTGCDGNVAADIDASATVDFFLFFFLDVVAFPERFDSVVTAAASASITALSGGAAAAAAASPAAAERAAATTAAGAGANAVASGRSAGAVAAAAACPVAPQVDFFFLVAVLLDLLPTLQEKVPNRQHVLV